MLTNYFSIAWRNLAKNKLYSCLNIGGLATGICVCMLIMLYLAHERSYDSFHQHAERIFYPFFTIKEGDNDMHIDRMSYETGSILKKSDPAIETFLRVKEANDPMVFENTASPEKKFAEQNIAFADANFFDFFSFSLIRGDRKQVLQRPFSIVLTARTAEKYFGNTDPVGKLLKYDNKYTFEITGVAANPPSNSTIHYDFIASGSSLPRMADPATAAGSGKVEAGDFKTFLLLKEANALSASTRILKTLAAQSESKFGNAVYSLNKLIDRHKDYETPANGKYLKIFSWVGGIILLLALVNYMSLATARSTIRSKEVGVRKVLGADRANIVRQFYVESALFAILAFTLALILFAIFRPVFYANLQLNVDESFVKSPSVILLFAGLFLVTVFIAGSYPSWVLSSFAPVKVLYGKPGVQKGGTFVRKFFTVLQFTVSVTLIISSIVVARQLDFFRHTDTGINRENVVMIPFPKNISRHYLAFKRSVENIKGVENVSTSASPMFGGIDMTGATYGSMEKGLLVSEMYVDQSFMKMLGMRWKFSPVESQKITTKGQVVLNEEMAKKLMLPQNPLNAPIVVGRDSLHVVGVVKDFNFASLHHKIEPLCLFVMNDTDSAWYKDNGDCLFVKTNAHTNIPTLLESIRKIYEGLDRETAFEYHFLDDAFEAQYRAENRLSTVFNAFTGITLFIACLGLFGLAAFSATQRTKEIGIRKVLGADTKGIVAIIAGNFIKPVLLSLLIAIPCAWILMNDWLQDFAYRTTLSAWIFLTAGLLSLLIAATTVSFHSIKAALANPVKSLRTE